MKKISTRAPFVIIEDLHIKIRAESKRAQFNYFPIEYSNHRKKWSYLITTKSIGYVLTNTQIINWSYVLVTSIFYLPLWNDVHLQGFRIWCRESSSHLHLYRSLNSHKFLRIYLVRPSKVDMSKTEMKLRTSESWNLMPLFYICLLKSWK